MILTRINWFLEKLDVSDKTLISFRLIMETVGMRQEYTQHKTAKHNLLIQNVPM